MNSYRRRFWHIDRSDTTDAVFTDHADKWRRLEESAHQLIADLNEANDDIDRLLACLLWSEWVPSIQSGRMCGCCVPGGPRNEVTGHLECCPLDAILTKLGLDDQAKRDAAREEYQAFMLQMLRERRPGQAFTFPRARRP